jgi:uncharacterized membrane protein
VPGVRTERVLRLAAIAISIVTAVGLLWQATVWQNSVRTLMHLPEVSGVHRFGVASLALLVFGALLVLDLLQPAIAVPRARVDAAAARS